MSEAVEYKTLDEVHKAFVSWESDGKSHAFGIALWETAERCVREAADIDYDSRFDKEALQDAIFSELHRQGSLRRCMTDGLRKLVIRFHARGLSTSQTIEAILYDDTMAAVTPFWVFKYSEVCGYTNIQHFLVSRLSYLKPSHPRFPNKFRDYWQSEREAYVDRIKDIPLSQPIEQLLRLSEHYTELETAYQSAESAVDKERYHKCMVRTMGAIHLITRDPSIKSPRQTNKTISESSPQALPIPREDVIDIPASETAVVKANGA